MKKSGMAKSITAALVCEETEAILQELFGATLAQQTKVISFTQNAVTIQVSSSVLSQEMMLNKEKILETINAKLGSHVVKQLRFLA